MTLQNSQFQLIGITDTAMLSRRCLPAGRRITGRLICSEKQALDATLSSLEKEDPRFRPIADKYWKCRGGSHTDGGSFHLQFERKERRLRYAAHLHGQIR